MRTIYLCCEACRAYIPLATEAGWPAGGSYGGRTLGNYYPGRVARFAAKHVAEGPLRTSVDDVADADGWVQEVEATVPARDAVAGVVYEFPDGSTLRRMDDAAAHGSAQLPPALVAFADDAGRLALVDAEAPVIEAELPADVEPGVAMGGEPG